MCLREILGRERRGNVGYSKWEKEREEMRVQNSMQGGEQGMEGNRRGDEVKTR